MQTSQESLKAELSPFPHENEITENKDLNLIQGDKKYSNYEEIITITINFSSENMPTALMVTMEFPIWFNILFSMPDAADENHPAADEIQTAAVEIHPAAAEIGPAAAADQSAVQGKLRLLWEG